MDDKILLALFDKFDKSDLAEMKYTGNGYSFELRRKEACLAPAAVTVAAAPVAVPAPAASASAAPSASAGAPEAPSASGLAAGNEYVTSPIVGTFYRSPSPDAPAFADVGKKIAKGQKLCIIEAMKMMNALEAEFDCEIVRILANNGDMVEFDQPIFEVKPL